MPSSSERIVGADSDSRPRRSRSIAAIGASRRGGRSSATTARSPRNCSIQLTSVPSTSTWRKL